ncbi:hypothetical protein [Porphyrobacter sp. AAP82]|uniref:hypothetical protein n=1 Tax=Porphyrobacter sp. AAP82 TaxID=1248917 RepID=UPI0012DC8A66|nr:hypothetical protein [Porphyrobacter sp. AAP82]
MTAPASRTRTAPKGGPLVMLALLIGGWCGARVMWWEDPLAPGPAAAAQAPAIPVPPYRAPALVWGAAPIDVARARVVAAWEEQMIAEAAAYPQGVPEGSPYFVALAMRPGLSRSVPVAARPLAAAAAVLPALAGSPQWRLTPGTPGTVRVGRAPESPPAGPAAPYLPPALPVPVAARPGRWSLDSWAFWRQGSSAAPVSQGRVPVYGASQAGAVLQYRIAPASGHDPRLYLRAYRALVTRGENEAALGASLRPLARVPVRLAGEVRYTDAAFFNSFRPAAYAVTEIPPLALPLGAEAELYAQGGWVGGRGKTPFADAQASITRELPWAARFTDDRLRLRLGAGAWGGAQKDAQRLDLGPTLRFDTRIGKVPARIAVDWRMRVAGDAAPGSGVAVTVAAGF